MSHIIKRRGQKQEFDERKLYGSIYAACLSAHENKEVAETMANLICREVTTWIEGKEGVTSDEIFKKATSELKHLNKDASFMYQTHRDLS